MRTVLTLGLFAALSMLQAMDTAEVFNLPEFAKISAADRKLVEREMKNTREVRRVLKNGQDAFNAGNKDLAKLRLMLVLTEIENTLPHINEAGTGAHNAPTMAATMKTCFFSHCFYYRLLYALNQAGMADKDLLDRSQKLAELVLVPAERGPNNRPFHYALGQMYAAKLFPDSPKVKLWQEYSDAVFHDWYDAGDSYEPGYVAHNISQAIELGLLLGKEKELKSDYAKIIYQRYRDHISQSGLTQAPGDGGVQDDYLGALIAIAELTGDPTFHYVADKVFWAGNYGNTRFSGKRRERTTENLQLYNRLFAKLHQMKVPMEKPENRSIVQSLYGGTDHPQKDRIILKSDENIQRFAQMYINDSTNTTFHGHEDNRGEIMHYEVDGTIYMLRAGEWSKWPGHANILVVTDKIDEFPYYQSRGITPGHWYQSSSNMRLIRDYLPDKDWHRNPKYTHGVGQQAFVEAAREYLGYSWCNPNGQKNLTDKFILNTITLNLQNTVKGAKNQFPQTVKWYREYRDIAPSDGTYELLLDDLAISGPAGRKILEKFDRIPENLSMEYFPEGSANDPALKKVYSGSTLSGVVSITPEKQLKVICQPGLTVLNFNNYQEKVDFNTNYNRIDFRYSYPGKIAGEFLRAPIKVAVNGECPRSMYADHQQGGLLSGSKAEDRNGDLFARVDYKGIFSHDSNWTRKMLFTREGYLIVLDEYTPGLSLDNSAAGPVWHIPNVKQYGINYFSSMLDPEKNRAMTIYFHPRRGDQYGVQYQPKLWNSVDFAVFSKRDLMPGQKEYFLTVMVPHDGSIDAKVITGKRNHMNNMIDPRERFGIQTQVDEQGKATVSIDVRDRERRWKNRPISITIDQNQWNINRGRK